jgi:hypothetical protein
MGITTKRLTERWQLRMGKRFDCMLLMLGALFVDVLPIFSLLTVPSGGRRRQLASILSRNHTISTGTRLALAEAFCSAVCTCTEVQRSV